MRTTASALLCLTLFGFSIAGGLHVTRSGFAAPPPVAEAEEKLKDGDHRVRIEALRELEALGYSARAEKAVIRALEDDDWGVQIRAAATLGKIGKDPAVKQLVELAVEGEIAWVREAAIAALQELKVDDIASKLLDRAKGRRNDPKVTYAIQAAGELATIDHVKRLSGHLKGKDMPAAGAAAYAIGRQGKDAESLETVLRTLSSTLGKRDDKRFFFAYSGALRGLAENDLPGVRDALVDELLKLPDMDLYVPERVARGLARMDATDVARALSDGLSRAGKPEQLRTVCWVVARAGVKGLDTDLAGLQEHKDERVRSQALAALGLTGEAVSAAVAEKALDDDSVFVRVEAVTAARRLMEPAAFRKLLPRIQNDKSSAVRLQYVVELSEQGDFAAIPELGKLAQDESWRVASAAIATIGTLGVVDDMPHVAPHTESKSWKIRAAAFEALGRLRAAPAMPLLIQGLDDRDPVVKGVCHANLQILARERLPADKGAWEAWWSKNGSGLALVKQSRRDAKQRAADADKDKANSRYGRMTREQGVEILQRARIIVITGAWDKVEVVLGHLEIPHSLMRAQQLKDAGLNPNQIVLVNCEGNMDKDTLERVQWFVNVGGYLMSTDWALTKTVIPAFPGYMKQFSGSSTGNDVVVVEEGHTDHPLTTGVFENVPALKWWLEIQAFPITVLYPERCEVLVDSAEMRQRYGSSPMGTVFHWGLGKVQHSISHFYLQEEGMTQAQKGRERMVFAADNLGLSLDQIRDLAKQGRFEGRLNEETMKAIAPDYSMFRMIVNMVREKSEWVENL